MHGLAGRGGADHEVRDHGERQLESVARLSGSISHREIHRVRRGRRGVGHVQSFGQRKNCVRGDRQRIGWRDCTLCACDRAGITTGIDGAAVVGGDGNLGRLRRPGINVRREELRNFELKVAARNDARDY